MVSDASVILNNDQALDSHTQEAPEKERYILTQVGDRKIAFPAVWVNAILQVERQRILTLPFYAAVMLGVVHYQGEVVQLFAAQSLLKSDQPQAVPMRETLTVIRLNQAAREMAGIGLVVDQVLGSISTQQMAAQSSEVQVFQLESLPSQAWLPQRWRRQS